MQSDFLRSFFSIERDQCNQMVASVRHQYPALDLQGFEWFLKQSLDPLILLLDNQQLDGRAALAHAGFQHGLELAARQWFKDADKRQYVELAWRELYPTMLPWMLSDPLRWLAKIQNVIHHLLLHKRSAPQQWVMKMLKVLPQCTSAENIDKCGVVCAWMVGMAHYRNAARQCLDELPQELLAQLFELPVETSVIEKHRQELLTRSWPVPPAGEFGPLFYQGRFGGSELLNGEFRDVPVLTLHEQQIYVRTGDQHWALYVDRFGHSLIPIDRELASELDFSSSLCDFAVFSLFHEPVRDLSELRDIKQFTQACLCGDTLVLSSAESFSLVLLSVYQ